MPASLWSLKHSVLEFEISYCLPPTNDNMPRPLVLKFDVHKCSAVFITPNKCSDVLHK